MKECTFKPKLNKELKEEELKPQIDRKVNGLEKYLQMRDLAKKQQEEKKKREEEVFGIAQKYNAAKHEGFTVPQPFALSAVLPFIINETIRTINHLSETLKWLRN
jgi:hypothetical protein